MPTPKKPTRLKILDGDQPCRINTYEPKSPPGLGEAPPWLDDLGREMWATLKARLDPMMVATRADEIAAGLFCQDYATWRKALDRINAEGLTIETETTIKAHPCIAIVNQFERNMVRMLGRFGLTPADRSGLHVRETPEGNGVLEYFKPMGRGDASGRSE
jgi:P27 family predicted phage terminase small subunit